LSLKNMKILQIDKNSSYGAEIRSCNYQELIEIYSAYQEMDEKAEDVCRGNEKLNISTNASNNKKAASVPGNPTKITVNSGITPVDELAKFNYQFSVDLTPKLLLSNGFLQELLATYDISEYITFVLISNSFIYTDKCYSVPTTEYGCLNSPLIGFWQKPKLIQFMWDVKKYGDLVEKEKCYREKGINIKKDKDQVIFRDTMKQQFEYFKLNNEIRDVIGHAIALNLNDEYLNEHPRLTYDKICLYVSSINSNMGVNSPYVYPLYGLSELAQTFCRKSAVNGTVFRLGTPILSIRGNGYAEECNNSHVEECDNSHVEECEGIEAIVGNKNNDFEKNVSKAPNLKVCQLNDSGCKNFIIEFYDPIESKVSRAKAKHIISDPSYVKSLVKPIYSVIRCTCIIKGTPSLLP
ncbi:putative secretory pathway GDP dissociation inhibitor 1, partial [Dictyocoela roeselum]